MQISTPFRAERDLRRFALACVARRLARARDGTRRPHQRASSRPTADTSRVRRPRGDGQDAGLATPWCLAPEFALSSMLPLEFGASCRHVVVAVTILRGLRVEPTYLRRACEIQARSHMRHLREGIWRRAAAAGCAADLTCPRRRPRRAGRDRALQKRKVAPGVDMAEFAVLAAGAR